MHKNPSIDQLLKDYYKDQELLAQYPESLLEEELFYGPEFEPALKRCHELGLNEDEMEILHEISGGDQALAQSLVNDITKSGR